MARATRSEFCVIFILIATAAAQIPILQGCFSSSVPLVSQGTAKYQSSGKCNIICTQNDRLVLGLSNGTVCWCGNQLPPADTKVPSGNCDTPCQGYNKEDCGGGTQYFTIWLTELGAGVNNVPNFKGRSSVSPTRTGSAATGSPATNGGSTPSSSGSAGQLQAGSGVDGKGSSNQHSDEDVAIAVGVVIGVVALALMGFIFWWTARRRKRTGTFARFQDGSVDGSSSVLQAGKPYTGSTAESAAREPEMTALPRVGPAIYVQQPTQPASPAHGSIAGVAAPAAAVAGETSLRPAASRGGSRASSETDPFYTPMEQPPIPYRNQSGPNALKAQGGQDSSSEKEEVDDTLSPLETIRGPERSRSIDGFDFGPGTSPMPGPMPGYFGPREYFS